MSPPPPWIVHVPDDSVWPPAGVAAPMSAHDHPVGHPGGGGGGAPPVMETVSKVTAEPVPWLCDVIASPASNGWPRFGVWVDPAIAVQLVPSADVYAVNDVEVPAVKLGRANDCTPVTPIPRMSSSACSNTR